MFDDEKIRLIEKIPDADTILVIWFKLLAQAGKTNASGYIYLNENIPYTDEMLATIFDRPLNTVRLALQTFKQYGMIELNDEEFLKISNWEKHQNVEGMDKIREQNRLRVQKYREKQKELELPEPKNDSNVTCNVTVTDIDKDKNKNKKEDKKEIYNNIVNYLNLKTGSNYRPTSNKTQQLINGRLNDGFTIDDFKRVIDNKVSEWFGDPKMEQYLRPPTLFGTKFESYLNQSVKPQSRTQVFEQKIKESDDGEFDEETKRAIEEMRAQGHDILKICEVLGL